MLGATLCMLLAAPAAALAADRTSNGPPAPPIAKLGWAGKTPPNFAPAYLASGLFGVRVPPSALARPGACGANCTNNLWGFNNPTTSCLVGGYVYNEPIGATDGQSGGQTGTSPAPFPFETEVLVQGSSFQASFQATVQGPDMDADPAVVTPLSQSLEMETGELSTSVKFGAKDGSWSIELSVVQLISQSVPSLGLQQITVTNRTKGLNITIVPKITTYGLPGTAVTLGLPRDVFHEGEPSVLKMRSNSGAELAMQVQTTCLGADHADAKGKPLASSCISSHDSGLLTMQSFHAVVGDASHSDPGFGAVRQAHYGYYRGWEKLRAENQRVWRENWRSRVVVSGPGVTAPDQAALDAAVFYLLSSAHTSSRNGLPIDAYSCLEYGGRLFWDADLWMVPPLAVLSAPAAGAVMGFRGRTIEMAKRNAGLYGLQGAHYPWETAPSDGHDAAVAPTGWSEQHISLDVALGTIATARALNDSEFNRETAFPVVSNVAAWLLSRGTWTSRGFEVLHMGGPDETLGQVNNSNFFNIAGMLVLEAGLDLARQMPTHWADAEKLQEWEDAYTAMVLEETDGVIKPFAEAPDELSKATPDNWSLGSLQYLLTAGLGLPTRINTTTINHTLEAEEIMRHHFPASGSVPCSEATEWFICAPMASITAYLGNRTESQSIASSFAREYMLPPFYITTEIRAAHRNFGHYMTNWGASLSSIMFGMTGLQLGQMGTAPISWGDGRVGALPHGWERISYEGWLGGKRYQVIGEHGRPPQITPVASTQVSASEVDWRVEWHRRNHHAQMSTSDRRDL